MLETGTILAGYRIDGLLGQGGMGSVYVATQLSLNRTVALKVLAVHLSDDATFRERFRREGLVQAALDHPHIVPIYEAGETEQGLFLAMRLIRGRNLKERILAGELDTERTPRILTPVARALDAAHDADLLHRDVKPQNILVGADDHGYLADFGLGRPGGDGGLTKTGEWVGTLDYVAPEQVSGRRAGAPADVYAFAAVLYECLTGAVPYPRDSDAAILYAHVSEPVPAVSAQRPELPAELNAVIARAMAKKPGQRHARAGLLMEEVEAALVAAGPLGAPEAAPAGRVATTEVREAAAEHGPTAGSCPSCSRESGTDGGFCPYCGSELPTEGSFEGFGRDTFNGLGDPFRAAGRARELRERLGGLWEALADALPTDDAAALAAVAIDELAAGEQRLESRSERDGGGVALALTLTAQELQVGIDCRRAEQCEAFVAWLSDDRCADALEELAGYRLIAWVPPAAGAAVEEPDEPRRIFDRDCALIDEPARRELVRLATSMERVTGMSSLWWRPPIALQTAIAADEAARLGPGLTALVAAELGRLIPLAREIDHVPALAVLG